MPDVSASIEIARPPEAVWTVIDEVERHAEWQEDLVSVRRETEGPIVVGSRAVEVRTVPGGKQQESRWEVTQHDAPRAMVFQVIDGPIRVTGKVRLEPVGDGSSTKLTVDLDFTGHGFGKLVVGLARSHARKQAPKDQANLKRIVESSG